MPCCASKDSLISKSFNLFYLCQPNHPGKLVQVGMNMGPHHARVLGWAKSYTKKLDIDTMIEYDLDAVGGLSIMWSCDAA